MALNFFLPARGDINLVPIWPNAGAPSSSTLAGVAGPNDLLLDTTGGTFYQNTGSSASPTWTAYSSLSGATVNVGASGTAGTLAVFPGTASKGKTELTASDNSGNTITDINTAAQAGARTYTVPDQGGDATFLLTRASFSTTTGLTPTQLPFLSFRNSDGTAMSASASAGKFGISVTLGTSEFLLTEAANSNTKTDVAITEIVLPPNYINGNDITVTAHCNYTLGSGTVGTHTLAAAAYLNAANGTQGSTLIATAAQTVPASDGAVTFTITGATLTAGSRLTLSLTLVIQDTGGSNITAQVNSVTLS